MLISDFLQVIVASRCVHFRSMFNSRMREALQVLCFSCQEFDYLTIHLLFQPEIIIEDAGPVAFSRMLEFLYRFFQTVFFSECQIFNAAQWQLWQRGWWWATSFASALTVRSIHVARIETTMRSSTSLPVRWGGLVLLIYSMALVMCNGTPSVLRGIHAALSRCLQCCIFAWSMCVLYRWPLQGYRHHWTVRHHSIFLCCFDIIREYRVTKSLWIHVSEWSAQFIFSLLIRMLNPIRSIRYAQLPSDLMLSVQVQEWKILLNHLIWLFYT